MTRIFIDADACPVRDETYRVALRYGLHTYVVSNRMIAVPDTPLIERVVVTQGMDVADDWIAEHAAAHDIVISADIPLAARCVANGACVLEPRGRILDQDAIGMALAMRNLMTDLRDTGAIMQGSRGLPGPTVPRSCPRWTRRWSGHAGRLWAMGGCRQLFPLQHNQ